MLRRFLSYPIIVSFVNIAAITAVFAYLFLECWPVHFYSWEPPDHLLNGLNETLIISADFSPWERDEIIAAGQEWETATEHGIKFAFRGQNIPINSSSVPSDPPYEFSQKITIDLISENSIQMIWQDIMSGGGGTVLGFYDPSNRKIMIVKERISDKLFRKVLTHELGHANFLGHSNSNLDIMYPYIDIYSDISFGDIDAICKIVLCPSH